MCCPPRSDGKSSHFSNITSSGPEGFAGLAALAMQLASDDQSKAVEKKYSIVPPKKERTQSMLWERSPRHLHAFPSRPSSTSASAHVAPHEEQKPAATGMVQTARADVTTNRGVRNTYPQRA